MPNVPVAAVSETDPTAGRVQNELDEARATISERAFWLSTQGGNGGSEMEYWLRAERELFQVPACELVEQHGDLRLRAAVPGLDAKELQLTAMPDSIVIESASSEEKGTNGHQVVFSEISRNRVLRHVALPARIDLGSVKAKLDRGMLEITAAKEGLAPRKAARRSASKTAKTAPAKPITKSAAKGTRPPAAEKAKKG